MQLLRAVPVLTGYRNRYWQINLSKDMWQSQDISVLRDVANDPTAAGTADHKDGRTVLKHNGGRHR